VTCSGKQHIHPVKRDKAKASMTAKERSNLWKHFQNLDMTEYPNQNNSIQTLNSNLSIRLQKIDSDSPLPHPVSADYDIPRPHPISADYDIPRPHPIYSDYDIPRPHPISADYDIPRPHPISADYDIPRPHPISVDYDIPRPIYSINNHNPR
jgi:hypothetical protein